MANKRYIETKFWDDNYIAGLDPSEKLLFLYFLTNPLTKLCGVYELPLRRIAFDTGLHGEMIMNITGRFSKDKKIYYLPEGWVYIKNFVRYQDVNPKIHANIIKSFEELPAAIKAQMNSIDPDYDRLSIGYHSLSGDRVRDREESNKGCGKVENLQRLNNIRQTFPLKGMK